MKEKLLELIQNGRVDALKFKSLISHLNTADIAELFGEYKSDLVIQFFRLLPKEMAADVFASISPTEQEAIINALSDYEIGEIVNSLFADDAVDFIEEMPASVVTRVLQNVSAEKRKDINYLLQYPDDSAGSIMTTEYIALLADDTVREAFDRIRSHGINSETIYTCYVIRHDRLLVGVVSAKTLMLSKQDERIGNVMDKEPVYAQTTDDQELVASLFKKYGLLAMPVVDRERRLVGIITVDDIVQVIEEENTEDFEKMNALAPSDEPYLKTSIFKLARNRIVWLLVLMLSATVTGGIISGFEDALAVLPMLVAFIPMLMDTGGNAGSQTSTLIIRGMALEEIRLREIFKVLWRELRIGVLCGLALAAINFFRIYFMNHGNTKLALTVSGSLLATVIMAKTTGCVLPMLAKKINVDPAIMAAPLITTIVDAASLIIFFTVAKLMFGL